MKTGGAITGTNGHHNAVITSLLKVAGVLVLAWVALQFMNPGDAVAPPATLAGVSRSPGSPAIRSVEFQGLLDQKKPFSSLAKKGYYTVVEVYLNTCAMCKKLESGFKAFVAKRKDTYIRRVHFPEEGIHFSFTGNSQAEIQRQADETNALMQSYNMCGTPHVLIFGPDRTLIASDKCGATNTGTRTLQAWINNETGLLAGSLGTATSLF